MLFDVRDEFIDLSGDPAYQSLIWSTLESFCHGVKPTPSMSLLTPTSRHKACSMGEPLICLLW